jgi:hypothetical protein
LEKAAQKLLLNWSGGRETSTAQFKKVFCFFFSKKEALPLLAYRASLPRTAAQMS